MVKLLQFKPSTCAAAATITKLSNARSPLPFHHLHHHQQRRSNSTLPATHTRELPRAMSKYTDWSHDELVKRVTQLEAELRSHTLASRQQQQQHQQQPNNPPPLPAPQPQPQPQTAIPTAKHKKHQLRDSKKQNRAFDPSRYHTRLIALKFAYLGGNYNGFEHHRNNVTRLPTVEEEMWKALRKTKLIFPRFGSGSGSGSGDGGGLEKSESRAGKRDDEAGGWQASLGWHPWSSGEERKEEVSWEGCEYSKCGRTDVGVSAFGQVIGVRVRSSRPKGDVGGRVDEVVGAVDAGDTPVQGNGDVEHVSETTDTEHDATLQETSWDDVTDELPYLQLLNRVLPPDIRVLAWCPNPPSEFSARFSCRERRYRYFFTNPGYLPTPGCETARGGNGWLNIAAMQTAAKKLEGLHDFRNFCKVDASKQITNFQRRIFYAGIHRVTAEGNCEVDADDACVEEVPKGFTRHDASELYFFEVRGSAFLWHQVRHMVAILFLVGQGYEQPSLVEELLDTSKNPAGPVYDMASDAPLVLWDCIFPDLQVAPTTDHRIDDKAQIGFEDALQWVHIGDGTGSGDSGKNGLASIGKYGRNGVMEDLWALWSRRRIDEVLAGSLMDSVARLGSVSPEKALSNGATEPLHRSDRVFDGSDSPVIVGKYTPVMKRRRKEAPEVLNARYAARKGLNQVREPEERDSQIADE